MPTLILHGDDDQIVPIVAAAMISSKIVPNATLKVYPGGRTAWRRSRPSSSTRICWPSSRAETDPPRRQEFRHAGAGQLDDGFAGYHDTERRPLRQLPGVPLRRKVTTSACGFSRRTASLPTGDITGNAILKGEQFMPKITALANGNFAVAFIDNGVTGTDDIRVQIFNDRGNPVGEDFVAHDVTSGTQTWPDMVTLPDGGFVMCWESNNVITVRAFTGGGSPGPEIQIPHKADININPDMTFSRMDAISLSGAPAHPAREPTGSWGRSSIRMGR